MKLIKPSFEIITDIDGNQILIDIEKAARTCYKSEEKIIIGNLCSNGELYDREPISAKTLITKLIKNGHLAMLEFGGMITVKFICDRGISHELVRHRLCSFAQESTRYCNYGKEDEVSFIDIKPFMNDSQYNQWINAMEVAEDMYLTLIQYGCTPQIARSVLPNSLKTEINISANLREWREIFRQRMNKAAHPQMRELMIPLFEKFKQKIPVIFDDL